MRKTKLPRRQFIKGVAVAAAVFPACSRAPSRWRFFTETEGKTISAISEQIIPADQDPGALYAGVPNFVDKQLVGPYKRFQQSYRDGLAGVDEVSIQMFGGAFASLNWESQTAVLRALESGKAKSGRWETQSASSFFVMVRDHCLQGFYGSPRHGGNRNYVSYGMMKLDYPQVIGQNRYRKT